MPEQQPELVAADLPMTLYLNQRWTFDLLAALQGGFTNFTTVQTTSSDGKENTVGRWCSARSRQCFWPFRHKARCSRLARSATPVERDYHRKHSAYPDVIVRATQEGIATARVGSAPIVAVQLEPRQVGRFRGIRSNIAQKPAGRDPVHVLESHSYDASAQDGVHGYAQSTW